MTAQVSGRVENEDDFRRLAAYWAEFNGTLEGENISAVYFSPNPTLDEIRLVEVQEDTFDAVDDRVFPIFFRPEPSIGLPVRLAIVLASPNDIKKLLNSPPDLLLPQGWSPLEKVPVWAQKSAGLPSFK